MTDSRIRALLIEDDPGDYDYIQVIVMSDLGPTPVEFVLAERVSDAIRILAEEPIDVIVSDLTLPDSTGLDTLRRVQKAAPEQPIVVLTGVDDDRMGLEAIREGAQDYLVKGHIDRDLLLKALRYAIERKQAELSLERYAADLERSNRDLAHFAHIVSHDLKEPLSTITIYLRLLQERAGAALDAESREFVDTVLRVAGRMNGLIRSLLGYARVGHDELATADVDMSALLERVMADLQSVVDANDAEIEAGELPTIRGDEMQISLLLQNLIANGIKFRHPDEVPRIRLAAEREGDLWHFTVTDNGIGIPSDDVERIFQPFQRVVSKQMPDGSGIGLATCAKVVERHGGRIWAESVLDEGSTFHFTLPVHPAASPADSPPARQASHTG